jgi:hypothetical protein
VIIVHITKPSGVAFEITFKDGTPEPKILASITKNRQMYGRVGTIKRTDPTFGRETEYDDPNAPWALDHPETCIDIGMEGPGRTFVVTKRLKGPPLKKLEATKDAPLPSPPTEAPKTTSPEPTTLR